MFVTLESQQINRVPVLTGPIITLAESVAGNEDDEALLPGLPDAMDKDALLDMKKALVSIRARFVLGKFTFATKQQHSCA